MSARIVTLSVLERALKSEDTGIKGKWSQQAPVSMGFLWWLGKHKPLVDSSFLRKSCWNFFFVQLGYLLYVFYTLFVQQHGVLFIVCAKEQWRWSCIWGTYLEIKKYLHVVRNRLSCDTSVVWMNTWGRRAFHKGGGCDLCGRGKDSLGHWNRGVNALSCVEGRTSVYWAPALFPGLALGA